MDRELVQDMCGRMISVARKPRRIVSLVPSQTELLYDLGLDDEVVGITKFCVHPESWFRSKKRVGGTKTVHLEIVRGLNPDLIIANKEENTEEQIEELATQFPVWVSDIRNVAEARQMIREVGRLVGRETKADELARAVENGFKELQQAFIPKRVAYFIWRDPWMCAGGDTFISDMIREAGWVNALADLDRYPAIQLDELTQRNIDLILLSSEPYPFCDKHIAEIQEVLPDVAIQLVDGELFSWYGSRMLLAPAYFKTLIQQPEA